MPRLAAPVGPGARERVERRDRDDADAGRHRKPLHGGNPDTQAGERAGAGRHRQQVETSESDTRHLERPHQIERQPRAVRARSIADDLGQHAVAATAALPARVVVSSERMINSPNVILAPAGSPLMACIR